MNTKKSEYLSLVKGAGIFLMLWGHCIQYGLAGSGWEAFENEAYQGIYSFHMPLLMLVSGYLFAFSFEKRGWRELVLHRCQPILHSIVFGSLLVFLTFNAGILIRQGQYSLLMAGTWVQNSGAFWFLWAVLISSVGVALVCKKIKPLWGQLLGLGAFAGVAALFPAAACQLYVYPYFVLGFYFARAKERIPSRLLQLRYLALGLFPLLLPFYEKKHLIYVSGFFGNGLPLAEAVAIDLFRWVIGLVGSVFLLVLAELALRLSEKTGWGRALRRGLAKLGDESLAIYVLSVPLLSYYLGEAMPVLAERLGKNPIAQNPILYDFGFTLLMAAAYSFLLYGVKKLLEKLDLSVLFFGR